jgi:hypothetical protein
MKRAARAKFEIAAVSVISKQTAEGGVDVSSKHSRT